MSSLGSMFGALTAPGNPLPGLPKDLGLPEKVDVGGGLQSGKNPLIDKIKKNDLNNLLNTQFTKANNYNKAFADLLNQQPQLNGQDRAELYDAYGAKKLKLANPISGDLIDYKSTLSQLTPEQFAAQRQQQAQQAVPQTAPAPQTVGPVPAPQEAPTPAVSTTGGNIAGTTKTTVSGDTKTGGSAPRRGRFATLLNGLGGATERFGA